MKKKGMGTGRELRQPCCHWHCRPARFQAPLSEADVLYEERFLL